MGGRGFGLLRRKRVVLTDVRLVLSPDPTEKSEPGAPHVQPRMTGLGQGAVASHMEAQLGFCTLLPNVIYRL